jgi:transcriptional regulator with AAA-type ATPase domain
MDGLKREKEMIFQKIGVSPRQTAIDYSGKFKDTSSLSYREIEDDLSGESDRMKNARDQIYRLAKRDNYMMI